MNYGRLLELELSAQSLEKDNDHITLTPDYVSSWNVMSMEKLPRSLTRSTDGSTRLTILKMFCGLWILLGY
jgi:hypothetical protein